MTTPPGGLTDWQYVTVNLTADATTDLLSFLAWGDNGNTVNLPPMVFLTGVNSPAGLQRPEPGSVVLLGIHPPGRCRRHPSSSTRDRSLNHSSGPQCVIGTACPGYLFPDNALRPSV